MTSKTSSQRLGNPTDEDGTGIAFDSSTMFQLPSGAYRSPDAAWILLERWEALTPEEQEAPPPALPRFRNRVETQADNS